MKYTHQKRPYRAECMQWNGANTSEVLAMFPSGNLHVSDYIMVRHDDGIVTLQVSVLQLIRFGDAIRHNDGIVTLQVGDWVLRGENVAIKFYPDADFNMNYQPLET